MTKLIDEEGSENLLFELLHDEIIYINDQPLLVLGLEILNGCIHFNTIKQTKDI